jgi:hypothetical protein
MLWLDMLWLAILWLDILLLLRLDMLLVMAIVSSVLMRIVVILETLERRFALCQVASVIVHGWLEVSSAINLLLGRVIGIPRLVVIGIVVHLSWAGVIVHWNAGSPGLARIRIISC